MDTSLLLTIIGLILGLISLTVTLYLARETLKLIGRRRAQRKLLNFDDEELVVVFPFIEAVPETLVPRTSAEDFAAYTVVLNILFEMEWRGKIVPVTVNDVSPAMLEGNLLMICAGKSNPLTNEVIEKAAKQFGYDDLFRFAEIGNSGKWQIRDQFATYLSPSYEQIAEYKGRGLVLREQEIHDVAMVAKIRNPWNPKNKVVILAGLRAIGTWGAAEFICKEWRQLYKRKSRFGKKKNGDFAAIVSVNYNNSRITGRHIEAFREFT